MENKSRIMGIDYGKKRTGIAISDVSGILASGHSLIEADGYKQTVDKILDVTDEYGITKIIIGYPRNMDGSEGEACNRVKKLAAMLKAADERLNIEFYDERLTTALAHTYLSQTGVRSKNRKKTIDILSAQIILQNYLDRYHPK